MPVGQLSRYFMSYQRRTKATPTSQTLLRYAFFYLTGIFGPRFGDRPKAADVQETNIPNKIEFCHMIIKKEKKEKCKRRHNRAATSVCAPVCLPYVTECMRVSHRFFFFSILLSFVWDAPSFVYFLILAISYFHFFWKWIENTLGCFGLFWGVVAWLIKQRTELCFVLGDDSVIIFRCCPPLDAV